MSVNSPDPVTLEEELPPVEQPDKDVAHCLGLLQPHLAMCMNELGVRGKIGWASFLGVVYNTIDDVMQEWLKAGKQ